MADLDILTHVLVTDSRVRLAVFFGSGARGTNRSASDLDVGVIVEPGSDSSAIEIALSRATRRSVDLVNLDVAPPLLRFEIARDGIVLVERVPHAWADFRARAMIDWWDWAPTARLFHASALSRLRRQTPHGSS